MGERPAPDDATTPAGAATASNLVAAMRTTVHANLVPELLAARRHLDDGHPTEVAASLERAHELALSLLRDPEVSGGPVAGLDRLVLAAVDRARRSHAGRLAVLATAPRLDDTTVCTEVADALAALVDEAAANAARHRDDATLHVHLTGDDRRVDVVARSTGTLHRGDGRASTDGAGMGLHLLRRRLTAVGGTLQVLHDQAATTLVATVPAGAGTPPPRDHGPQPPRPADDGR